MATFSYLFNETANGGINIGYNFFWILFINAIFAIFIAKAFSVSVQTHSSGQGGWFIFVRAWYGKKASFYSLFFHYLFYPVVISYLIIGLTRLEFGGLVTSWGPYQTTFLDLIGIAIYWIVMVLMCFGMKWIKKVLNFITFCGFLVFLILIIILIKSIITNHGKGWQLINQTTGLSLKSFLRCFTTVCGFFLGFSAFTTITGGVNNAPRNIGRGAVLVLTTITFISAITAFLLLGSWTGQQLGKNWFFSLNNSWWFKTLIITTLISSVILQIIMHNLFTIEGQLLPAAKHKFIPNSYLKRNQHGAITKSIRTNFWFGTISAIFFLIVPDVIVGQNHLKQSPFNVATLLQVISVFVMVIYCVVLSIAIKLKLKLKCQLVKWRWVGLWFISMLFLLLTIACFLYEILYGLIAEKSPMSLLYNGFLLIYLIFTSIFPVCWYLFYYKKSTKNNPQLFATMPNVNIIPLTDVERLDVLLKLALENNASPQTIIKKAQKLDITIYQHSPPHLIKVDTNG